MRFRRRTERADEYFGATNIDVTRTETLTDDRPRMLERGILAISIYDFPDSLRPIPNDRRMNDTDATSISGFILLSHLEQQRFWNYVLKKIHEGVVSRSVFFTVNLDRPKARDIIFGSMRVIENQALRIIDLRVRVEYGGVRRQGNLRRRVVSSEIARIIFLLLAGKHHSGNPVLRRLRMDLPGKLLRWAKVRHSLVTGLSPKLSNEQSYKRLPRTGR